MSTGELYLVAGLRDRNFMPATATDHRSSCSASEFGSNCIFATSRTSRAL